MITPYSRPTSSALVQHQQFMAAICSQANIAQECQRTDWSDACCLLPVSCSPMYWQNQARYEELLCSNFGVSLHAMHSSLYRIGAVNHISSYVCACLYASKIQQLYHQCCHKLDLSYMACAQSKLAPACQTHMWTL